MQDTQQNRGYSHREDADESIDIRQLVEQYGYYWKWVVAAVVLALCIAHLYLRYTERTYAASAKVMVLDKENAPSELMALGTLAPLNSNTALDDQIQIIRSSKLMQEVVRKNKFYITYHEMGRINHKELLADALPFSLEILDKTEAQQEELTLDIKLSFGKDSDLTVNQGNNGITAVVGKPFAVDGVKLLVSPMDGKPTAGRHFLVTIRPLVSTANELKGTLTVGRAEKSNTILNFGYTSFSQEKAEIILRDLIQAYDRDLSNDKNKVTAASTSFINERVNLITEDLQRVDKRVEDFKTSNKIVDVETSAGIAQGELTTFEKQLFDLQFQQQLIRYIRAEVQKKSMKILPENLGIQSAEVTTAVANLNRLLLERESLLKSATEENPVVVRLNEQIGLLYHNLQASIENALEVNTLGVRNVENRLRSLRSDLGSVPRNENDFKSIARQQQIVEAMYLFLLQKREEMEIAASAKPENIKIIEPAKGYGPIAPVARNYYLIGLVVGIVLPIGILFVKFMLDNKIHSRKDIEDRFSAPVLGELPTSEEPIVKENDRSSLAEAFRILRTNISFMLGVKKDTAVIFVTSTTSGEGKSFVATNLSRILSMSGKRVLLIGADIRSPKVLDYLGLSYL
ncbi:tyrosine protein kinase, partial [Parapusillimonas sp. SGNA-6]|nr:tyrosine protein kinase [Parapusillimonas sp. SGNA-6]